MECNQQLCFLAVLASFFCAIFACPNDDLYLIRAGGYQDFVLDGSDSSEITLQYFTNSTAQLWKFQRTGALPLYYIINNFTGKALDFQQHQNILRLVGKDQRNAQRQQWNVRWDGRIVNSQNRYNMGVQDNDNSPRARVILVEDNGTQAQEFVLTKLKDIDFEEWKQRQFN